MEMFLNNNPYFMFHEVLDNNSRESGWHLKSKGKYTISKQLFLEIIRKYGKTINYTFDDGGVSNLFSANQLKSHKIRGIFFICTDYIGKPGFLNLTQIKEISKSHFIFSHGHRHIMSNESFKDLFHDWDSCMNIMKYHGFDSNTVCLPGGFFTKNHYKVFSGLEIKYIFHSSPYNFILNFLYKKRFIFIPRIIITKDFKSIKKINYVGIKSLIKQVVDFLK